MAPLACPVCGSADVRRISLLYKQGSAETDTTSDTLGVAGVGDGFALGSARTRTRSNQQSLLAQELAPPPKMRPEMGTLYVALFLDACAGVLGIVLESWFMAVVCLLGVIATAVSASRRSAQADAYNETKWPRLYEEWQRGFLCLRCGERFSGPPLRSPSA
jgi:hypothetical protein